MTHQPRHHVRLLTRFLVVAGVISLASLLYSPSSDPEPVAQPEPSPSTAPTTSAAPTTTRSAPTPTTTTVVPETTVLEVLDPTQIGERVGPTVAFLTTFNGTGSGVLIGEDLLVTNAHVIWPFATVGVLFPGDSRRTGRVVGVDARSDLAFIQVESPRLPDPVPLGTSTALDDGQELFAVGYPSAEDFAPEPTVAAAEVEGVFEWAFSGSDWVATDAAAIGGQSGGALVDEYGRLVGITTFGSPVELYAVAVEDVLERAELAREDALGGLEERRPPREGGRLEHAIDLEGPWDQAVFVTWLSQGAESHLTSDPGVTWRALDPFGVELDVGNGDLDVFWFLATPGVVLAESQVAASSLVEVDRPLVALEDPDDARTIVPGPGLSGFMDVPGDRDWFYFDLADPATTTVVVEAQTRVRISLYHRETGGLVASVSHERGFFFEDPALVVEDLAAGSYVIAVEDVGAQFGTYRIEVE